MVDPATVAGLPPRRGGHDRAGAGLLACRWPTTPIVSQLHARIYVRDGKPFVEDLGSTNGTFLNRDRLSKTMPLHRGDKLQIGQTVLEIVQ